jgi:hypothetical protein
MLRLPYVGDEDGGLGELVGKVRRDPQAVGERDASLVLNLEVLCCARWVKCKGSWVPRLYSLLVVLYPLLALYV